MDWETLLSAAIRHGLTTAAGSLAAHGYIMSSDTEQFIGAGMFLVGLFWSWYQKRGEAILKAEIAKLKGDLIRTKMQQAATSNAMSPKP